MPEGTTTDSADDKQESGDKPAAPAAQSDARTFSQEELDAIVGERLRREGAKFSDYDALKARAGEMDKTEEASKTELEKATGKVSTETARADAAEARADRILRQSAIMAEAASQGAADAETVVALLAAEDSIAVDGDTVKGAKQAVKALLAAKPFLAGKNTPSSSGPAFGGQEAATLQDQLAEAAKSGDFREAIRLKTSKLKPYGS